MRVAFVTHQFPPRYTTGTELYAARLARRLRDDLGHEVAIHTYEPSLHGGADLEREATDTWGGLSVTRVAVAPELAANPLLSASYDVRIGKRFARTLERFRPDVVHVFHAAFHGASVVEEAFLAGVPVVWNLMDFWLLCPTVQLVRRPSMASCDGPETFACLDCLAADDATAEALREWTRSDGFDPWLPDGPVTGAGWNQPGPHAQLAALAGRPAFLRELALRCAARLVAPSVALRDVFVGLGYPEERLSLVPYGVDPSPVARAPRTDGAPLRVGFLGSLNPPKGARVLVEAAAGLEAPVRVDLFGDDRMFPTYAAELREAAGHDRRVRLRGRLAPDDVPAALAALDVLVVPSLWRENTPFVVLEARAAGVVVVGSDGAGIAELVRDGEDGLLFPPGDVAALRSHLRSLAGDAELLARLSRAAPPPRSLLDNARDFARMYAEVAAGA